MNPHRPSLLYPFTVGLLLGLLQSGLFFQLTFTLSSGFGTYLLITLCWLAGSVIGVYFVQGLSVSLRGLLVIMLFAYVACAWLVNNHPYDSRALPLYGALIVTAGLYPGVFFARAARAYTAKTLFFWENNGFIIGLVSCSILFMLLGRLSLWVAPAVFAAILWIAFHNTPRSGTLNPAR